MERSVCIIVLPLPRHVATPLSRGAHYTAFFGVGKQASKSDISTLRGFLDYIDEDMQWWQKRYSWELIDADRVMRDIERNWISRSHRASASRPKAAHRNPARSVFGAGYTCGA